jgi:DNA invertase Pin-like site-specific DNA recombinase
VYAEGGVSGFNVHAADRDALNTINAMAIRKEFDILGSYMSDRLGRIADETPLIVSFLNQHGIKVISYNEGEITSHTHADKLMTYIRYWQAEGESLKTSLRVSDALVNSVKQGRWRGGNIAYGYKTVSRGTLNFKGKPIRDVEIDEEQAEVVRKIFRLSRVDNYGIKRIARYLNDNCIPAQKGGRWGTTQVIQILQNKLYKGIYVLHSTIDKPQVVSPIMESFIIIPSHEWDETQERLRQRASRGKGEVKNTTHGKLLLSGLVFCGTCGTKMTTFGQKSRFVRKDGTVSKKKHYKYICGTHSYPSTEHCTGQTTFSSVKLERAVVDDVKRFLSKLNHKELIEEYLNKIDVEAKTLAQDFNAKTAAISRAEGELLRLKEEILKSLMGTSSFTEAMIKDLLVKKERELKDLYSAIEEVQNNILRIDAEKISYMELDSELDDWGARFERQTYEQQKTMILNVIDKILVFKERVEIIYDIKLLSFKPDDAEDDKIDNEVETVYNNDTLPEGATVIDELSAETDEQGIFLLDNFRGQRYSSGAWRA